MNKPWVQVLIPWNRQDEENAAQEASLYQRAQAAEKGRAAFEELKKLGITFHPMAKAERDALRRQMEAQLWPAFANQFPPTRPLFQAVASAR